MQEALCGQEDRNFVHPKLLLLKDKWNTWLKSLQAELNMVRVEIPEDFSELHPCGCRRPVDNRLFLVHRLEVGGDVLCSLCNTKVEIIR